MDVRQQIDRYLKATAMPPTKFGRLAVNDPRLVGDMRRGRQLGRAITQRIEAYLAEHRP
jgi:hypothetical protein